VLNKSGQSDHHRSYTQFGSVDKARDKADKDVAYVNDIKILDSKQNIEK
jgi:hypothetical protein